mmetsp:Transcript_142356/g.370840  ORF Transcript_142356/g.370840 Transcript_142356/m.370840 type:complete len:212 (+) Transcript_142356:1396-2031(+)
MLKDGLGEAACGEALDPLPLPGRAVQPIVLQEVVASGALHGARLAASGVPACERPHIADAGRTGAGARLAATGGLPPTGIVLRQAPRGQPLASHAQRVPRLPEAWLAVRIAALARGDREPLLDEQSATVDDVRGIPNARRCGVAVGLAAARTVEVDVLTDQLLRLHVPLDAREVVATVARGDLVALGHAAGAGAVRDAGHLGARGLQASAV